jgi:hypothetical protein
MSWEHDLFALFDDLEGQAAAAWEADREAELADRARTEYGTVTLASRLMASRGHEVALDLPHVGRVEGRLARVGEEWCLLSGARQDWIVPLRAVSAVRGASDLADGARHEAYVHRVGADFLEARDSADGELLVPYAGLVAVQSRDD